ncbi:endonuclease/exonuclease/phosphatase family protein [Streptomyces scabiei]|uniref:endonuclease/exonuclease/phosphatase family protein n=1 Tax=Streptomyces scabiei TaxID=1930 RepID=UPI0029A600D4|nr:endonuclease/exonuclease/phosphatase family protein [Streptomyces scabiei]MDX3517758.1 endonuclease/exonuclease/phosphatase family protein [Streptomyces scabiei]
MPPGTHIEEATVFGRGTWVFAGAVGVACLALVGPSTPGDGVFARSLPADAVKKVHPDRVMTWNICNPCDESNVDRAAEIAAVAPQVIGLQEACVRDVERIREYLETFHGLVYHVEYGSVLGSWSRCGGAPWNPGGFGQAILSAAPLTDRVGVEYPDGGSEDRGYMAVTATVGGRSVRIFNTHLAQRRQEAIRADQIDVLAEEVARYDRAIVLGDFNAVPDAAELAPMWKVAKDADTACRPPSESACGLTTDWQSKFDYVFLRGVSPQAQRVRLSETSDHNLVYADLDLT